MNLRLRRLVGLGATALALVAWSCRGSQPGLPFEEALSQAGGERLLDSGHQGPAVVAGDDGPARFTAALCEDFQESYARHLLAFVDGFYRAPGNDGYEAVLDRIESDLREAGYGTTPGLEVFTLSNPLTAPDWEQRADRVPAPAWTPVSASLTVLSEGREPRILQRFEAPGDTDRLMLPVNAPAASVEAPMAFDLEQLGEGQVLVTDALPRRSVLRRAISLGAVAVLSSYLDPYNVDPTGRNRQDDSIRYHIAPYGVPLPVAMISPRTREALESAQLADPEARVRLEAEVKLDERPLRTLVAVVRGKDRPQEAFAITSHVQEAGANDNGTGVVGLAESARSLARLLRDGRLERPSRSLVFIWGDEFRQTRTWVESTDMKPVGGLSSDMIGASRLETGAIALLERMPDPGGVRSLPPDVHTPWGRVEVDPASLRPNGLAIIARCALADVGAHEGGWVTSEHPYEGGSDHDIFIRLGLPTALFWHFTDFTYHTSLDRLGMVDHAELRRTACAILATALSVADPRPTDLDRYLLTLNKEQSLRVAAAKEAGDEALVQHWREWCEGARHWLRIECMRIPESER